MRIGLITCGALAREVLDIVERRGWEADILGVPALDHNHPERIAPHVEAQIVAWRGSYDRLVVVFGDCGTRGSLDALLARFPDIPRLPGPHCFEMYAGESFQAMMEEEPGTFFLTDFLLRGFEGLFVRELGLDRHPELREKYFKNYRKVVYLVQNRNESLVDRARQAADDLGLALELRETGYGDLETRLVEIVGESQDVS